MLWRFFLILSESIKKGPYTHVTSKVPCLRGLPEQAEKEGPFLPEPLLTQGLPYKVIGLIGSRTLSIRKSGWL